MNNHVYVIPGGGIFSRIFHCGITPLADKDFDNVYLHLSPFDLEGQEARDILGKTAIDYAQNNLTQMNIYGLHDPYDHVMSYIFNQHKDDTYTYKGFLPVGPIYDKKRRIEDSPRLEDYRRVVSKLRWRQDVIDGANGCCHNANINERTLGVHVRLTTMTLHNNYEKVTLDDYIKTIERAYVQGHYDKIFVSSDNHESLRRLSDYFGPAITSYPGFERLPHETIKSEFEWAKEADWFFQERIWHQAFYDMITLANCGGLVCRESNFTNMAVVWSKSIRDIFRVYINS